GPIRAIICKHCKPMPYAWPWMARRQVWSTPNKLLLPRPFWMSAPHAMPTVVVAAKASPVHPQVAQASQGKAKLLALAPSQPQARLQLVRQIPARLKFKRQTQQPSLTAQPPAQTALQPNKAFYPGPPGLTQELALRPGRVPFFV